MMMVFSSAEEEGLGNVTDSYNHPSASVRLPVRKEDMFIFVLVRQSAGVRPEVVQ